MRKKRTFGDRGKRSSTLVEGRSPTYFMNPIDICRLCLEERELINSHLVSKAAYKRLRDGDGKNPNPFVVNENQALQTSEQITGYALCGECEELLNKNGETTFFKYCYQPDGTFRLLAELRKTQPFYEDDT